MTLPFVLLLLLLLGIFSFFNLVESINSEIRDTRTINQILAKTVAARQTTLLSQQVDGLLSSRPMIKSIIFYPIAAPESTLSQEQNIKNFFFDSYLGISEPVYLTDKSNAVENSDMPNLIGYIHTTLDLAHIRRHWLISSLPMFGVIALLSAAILAAALYMVKRVTQRLPFLEKLSQDTLSIDFNQASVEQIDAVIQTANVHNQQNAQKSQRWIFEKALVYLLNSIRLQSFRYFELDKKLQNLLQSNLAQTIERAKIDNVMVIEVKMALKRMQAGLQLLTNHYISQEQQDAVVIIEQGVTELGQKMDQIIQLQRIERGQIGIEQHNFDPDSLIEQLLEKYSKIADDKQVALLYKNYHAKYMLEGDTQKITTIIASLVENALQYTTHGHIEITSRIFHLQDNLKWQVAVSDTGIGIPQKHFEDIFDPFFQVHPEDYAEISLLGVDLSLVKKLTKMINAEIHLSSIEGEGSIFTVTFLVNDWAQHFDKTLLHDKKIAFLSPQISQQDAYQNLAKRFKDAGANIEYFDNIEVLISHLPLYKFEAVLLMPYYTQDELMDLVEHIRGHEQRIRMRIIYYYEMNHAPNFDELRAAGVDYFEEFVIGDNNQDNYVKNLLKILS